MSDNLFTKKLTEEDVGVRDALHVAVVPVVAGKNLYAGQHVGVKEINGLIYASPVYTPHVGVVNPFPVNNDNNHGDIFLLLLYPGSIKSLRHAWEHDSFPTHSASECTPTKEYGNEHVRWITEWAESYSMTFDEVVGYAKRYVLYGDYVNHGPRFEGEYVPDEFWTHYNELDEIKGTKFENKDNYGSFFTCSC